MRGLAAELRPLTNQPSDFESSDFESSAPAGESRSEPSGGSEVDDLGDLGDLGELGVLDDLGELGVLGDLGDLGDLAPDLGELGVGAYAALRCTGSKDRMPLISF